MRERAPRLNDQQHQNDWPNTSATGPRSERISVYDDRRDPRPDGGPFHYERHRPDVKDEFDAFLECGILAHGFLRLRCGVSGHDKLVAFSCKRRGFCPSCGARRMAQTAAHLVDHGIPRVPVRQRVLSLPIALRLLMASQPQLLTPVLQVVHRVLTRLLLDQAGLKADEAAAVPSR